MDGVVSAKVDASAALAASPDMSGENVNYAVKSSFLLSFLEAVPDFRPNSKSQSRLTGSLMRWSNPPKTQLWWFSCIEGRAVAAAPP